MNDDTKRKRGIHTMRSKILVGLMGMLLLAFPLCAGAERIDLVPSEYNPQNDFPPVGLTHKANQTEEEIQALRHGYFHAPQLLPLPDGNVLLYGTFMYEDMGMEPSYTNDFDVRPARSDAYAIALDPDGNRIWSLRLGDPQAQNLFEQAWMMSDGRILMKYYNSFGTWGTQYYFVSLAGEVQEMLPSFRAKAYGVSGTLMPVAEGFLGGGQVEMESGSIGPLLQRGNIVLLDDAMEMIWHNEDPALKGGNFFVRKEAEEGYLLSGGKMRIDDPNNWNMVLWPAVLKLSDAGETVWLYEGHQQAFGVAADIMEIEDGGVLFVSNVDPTVPTAYESVATGTLTRLDSAGNHVWTKEYLQSHGFSSFTQIVPYRAGHLLLGALDDGRWGLLETDAEGNAGDVFALPSFEDTWHVYVGAVAAPDGSVYVYGNQTEYTEAEDVMTPKGELFFTKIET